VPSPHHDPSSTGKQVERSRVECLFVI
jgi:hypothetical protein